MTKKLTTAIAIDMVDRIERLNDQINEIYRESCDYDGVNNVNVIRNAWKARKDLREAQYNETALLAIFDVDDEAQ